MPAAWESADSFDLTDGFEVFASASKVSGRRSEAEPRFLARKQCRECCDVATLAVGLRLFFFSGDTESLKICAALCVHIKCLF